MSAALLTPARMPTRPVPTTPEETFMHPFSFEFFRLRQDELLREAERHRMAAAVPVNRARRRLSPFAVLSAIAARFRSPAPPPLPGAGQARCALTTEGGGS
jgi:hypothetical protein